MSGLTHSEMLEIQREFELLLFDPEAMSYEDRQRWVEKFAMHAIDQCTSLLNELAWKAHRPYRPVEYDQIVEELVDIQKYVLAMHVVLNVDPAEFAHVYRERSNEVFERYEKEMT